MLVADRTISHLYPQLGKLAAIAPVLPMSMQSVKEPFRQ